jgi:hypothetical protein
VRWNLLPLTCFSAAGIGADKASSLTNSGRRAIQVGRQKQTRERIDS